MISLRSSDAIPSELIDVECPTEMQFWGEVMKYAEKSTNSKIKEAITILNINWDYLKKNIS